ncbi:LOW QUALITY PROTEIN: ATP synthase F(0) complex subunit f, mitochondrial [Diretmus argenteus]
MQILVSFPLLPSSGHRGKRYIFTHNAPLSILFPSFPDTDPARIKMADRPVAIAEKRLMDVKLGELGSWVGGRDFSPNGILSSIRRGHDRYYNKYINVKRGGIGGIAMLLFGYMAISYTWGYDHLKHDRWRKYH